MGINMISTGSDYVYLVQKGQETLRRITDIQK